MKRILILSCLTVFFFVSCTKDNQLQHSDNQESVAAKPSLEWLKSNQDETSRKLSGERQKEAEDKFVREAIQKIRLQQARPGLCPIMYDAYCRAEITCNYPNGDVTFTWTIVERTTPSGETLAYDFDVETNWGTYPVTPTQINEEDLGCDETGDVCLVRRTFQTTLTLSSNEIKGSYRSTVTATCSLAGSTPTQIITPWTSFGYTQSDYLNDPARIYPYGYTGHVFVGTECSSLCTGTYVTCPQTVNFRYILSVNYPSGTWTYPTIPSTGAILSVSPAGQYNWECTITYPFGTSQMSSGIFIVN